MKYHFLTSDFSAALKAQHEEQCGSHCKVLFCYFGNEGELKLMLDLTLCLPALGEIQEGDLDTCCSHCVTITGLCFAFLTRLLLVCSRREIIN